MKVKKFGCLALLASIGGCSTIPTSGPTGHELQKSARAANAPLPIQIVEMTNVAAIPASLYGTSTIATPASLVPPPTDMIGPGDILNVTIYEAGVTLFSGSGTAASADTKSAMIASSPGVQAEKLPPSRVDDRGDIVVPYAGKLHVAGRTAGQVEAMIRTALRPFSQNPQIIVTLGEVITNSIIISGEVNKPGRLVLQTNRETLSDVVALAGGYHGAAKDLTLRLVRRDKTIDLRLSDIIDRPDLDVRAYPGDRVMLVSSPRTFSVLGGSGRIEQVAFPRPATSLAQAVATAGGVSPDFGDAAAVFVFRYVVWPDGKEIPTVYHLNMMTAGAYFLAQKFTMQDGDILYVGNASSNRPAKLVQLISQLFSPVVAVSAAVRTQ